MTEAAGWEAAAPRHGLPSTRRVLIVGGGASGVLLAAQLLLKGRGRVAVRVVEQSDLLGCGVAYGTPDPAHLLNTRAAKMSAFPQQPEHFLDWLRAVEPTLADPQGFVSRTVYGRYMAQLLDGWSEGPALSCLRDECVALEAGPLGVAARLAGGGRVEADLAVLATGHALAGTEAEAALSQPWDRGPVPPGAAVLIVGSGLTMVDQVLSLLEAGHEGPITAVSRRGLLPQVHAPVEELSWTPDELPPPGRVAPLMRWLREQARLREAQGGTWRDVADAIRPHLQAIWHGLPTASRRSFLRHGSAHWEVHRHRMPPSSGLRLEQAEADGRLRLMRGRFDGALQDRAGRVTARLTLPGGEAATLSVDRIVDCRGVRRDPERHATPLIAGLLGTGAARVDPLRIGLDVGADCSVIGRDGTPSERLFAIGPASRAAFWEVTAIPDIRAQAALLADRLLDMPLGRER